jgi:site-specific recombinase XerD
VWTLAAFGKWLKRRGLTITDLRRHAADAFLTRRAQTGCVGRSDAATLRLFLDHLEAAGIIPAASSVVAPSPLAQLKVRYEAYLRNERGLSPLTGVRHWFVLGPFLRKRFGDGPIRVRDLSPDDMIRYVLRIPSRSSPSAQVDAGALRSFLRFLVQAGDIDRDLAAAIPPVRRWRLVDVPKYLKPDDVRCVLASCNRTTPVGRRDYAILLLLARLGLRGGEVVRLELDDLDWHAGELTVRGKGSVHARLPLPRDVGAALALYLRTDRPRCVTRRVFVCMRAPHRGFSHPSTVSTLVRVALARGGLTPPIRGAHLLRHSLATDLLRHGASLADIGEVLRHRLPQTTEIYAKVDIDRLRGLAQPWPTPGGGQ